MIPVYRRKDVPTTTYSQKSGLRTWRNFPTCGHAFINIIIHFRAPLAVRPAPPLPAVILWCRNGATVACNRSLTPNHCTCYNKWNFRNCGLMMWMYVFKLKWKSARDSLNPGTWIAGRRSFFLIFFFIFFSPFGCFGRGAWPNAIDSVPAFLKDSKPQSDSIRTGRKKTNKDE